MLLKYHTKRKGLSNTQTMFPKLTSHLSHCITSMTLRHIATPYLTLSAPHAILKKLSIAPGLGPLQW